jgi:hypothetical protein
MTELGRIPNQHTYSDETTIENALFAERDYKFPSTSGLSQRIHLRQRLDRLLRARVALARLRIGQCNLSKYWLSPDAMHM